MQSTSTTRFFKSLAVLLLFSTLTGLLAPAVVAMSEDKITTASKTEGLSSKVKDFFADVLEDAMIRSGAVAQFNSTNQNRVGASRHELFEISGEAVDLDSDHSSTVYPNDRTLDANAFAWHSLQNTTGFQPQGP